MTRSSEDLTSRSSDYGPLTSLAWKEICQQAGIDGKN
jgi:hypothetical protein